MDFSVHTSSLLFLGAIFVDLNMYTCTGKFWTFKADACKHAAAVSCVLLSNRLNAEATDCRVEYPYQSA